MDSVTTNELKKGTRVTLRSGWKADIADNMRGNIRMCLVYGDYTELGSVYSHDIMSAEIDGKIIPVKHTEKQLQCREMNRALFR
jgi:hypothetical protein